MPDDSVELSVKSVVLAGFFSSVPPEDAQPIAQVATASVATARENFPRRICFPLIPLEKVLTALAASAEPSRPRNAPRARRGCRLAAYSRDSPAPAQYRSGSGTVGWISPGLVTPQPATRKAGPGCGRREPLGTTEPRRPLLQEGAHPLLVVRALEAAADGLGHGGP